MSGLSRCFFTKLSTVDCKLRAVRRAYGDVRVEGSNVPALKAGTICFTISSANLSAVALATLRPKPDRPNVKYVTGSVRTSKPNVAIPRPTLPYHDSASSQPNKSNVYEPLSGS